MSRIVKLVMPDAAYNALKEMADSERRSLPMQIICLLDAALTPPAPAAPAPAVGKPLLSLRRE